MSPMLMFVEKFPASQAFPISSMIVLVCSLCTFYMGVKDKYKNPDNKFVDYDYAVIFCPPIIIGTKIGTILNKITPNLILCLILSLTVLYSFYKTYNNAQKQKEKELLNDIGFNLIEDNKYKAMINYEIYDNTNRNSVNKIIYYSLLY